MSRGRIFSPGGNRLRFLETPHVHHWDSMMIVEEHTRSLFPSDLFIQPGDQPLIVREDLGREMCAFYREIGIFASEAPVRRVAERVAGMDLQWIHPMHGGSLPADIAPAYVRALREEEYAFAGQGPGAAPGRVNPPSPSRCASPGRSASG